MEDLSRLFGREGRSEMQFVAQRFLAARRKKSSDALSCHFIASCVRFMRVIFSSSLGKAEREKEHNLRQGRKNKIETSLLIQDGAAGVLQAS